jgi:hypothetical protein
VRLSLKSEDPNGFSEQKYTHIEDEVLKKKKA